MNTDVIFESEARAKLIVGIDKLGKAVGSTLGPKGRNVLIAPDMGRPIITKDGVSVAKALRFNDPIEDAGANLLRNVAREACDNSGDGTTTATVLAHAIISGGFELIDLGYDPIALKHEIDDALTKVVAKLHERAHLADNEADLINVATISANGNKEIGSLIGKAVMAAGTYGSVIVREGRKDTDYINTIEGIAYDTGLVSQAFIPSNSIHLANTDFATVVYDGELDDVERLKSILAATDTYTIIFAHDFSREVIEYMVAHIHETNWKFGLVKTPGFASGQLRYQNDLLTIVGCELTSLKGYVSWGTVSGRFSRKHTVLFPNADRLPIITEYVKMLSKLEPETPFETKQLKERIASLTSSVVTITVGGKTEIEVKERKDLFDDALGACQAAKVLGIIPGGGLALEEIANALLAESPTPVGGTQMFLQAIRKPFEMILTNGGYNLDNIRTHLEDEEVGIGYDCRTDTYRDFLAVGIVDPLKVTLSSLEHACSIAGLLLTTSCVIFNDNLRVVGKR